ncbi:NAD-dependent epimerase/dehydratase family protein [Lewinella sp. W8]|uniref:NAD-dependent epimerase/dehydratase family protein n=1 Tax=Lewinella sp. W8 TaxID=2528208 RepID=UPI00106791DE|nr:NAD-dependent epimerase/dehydratase family protein [Lewinella sp. W8]MTB53226.1 NAD-dependent epimerase/dehydratase family protein [Lewinella sp. W8]
MILLTGATGFLGSHLAPALAARGREWAALVREDSDRSELLRLSNPPVFREGDLLDPQSLFEAFSGVEVVIHAAAMVSYRTADRDELLRVNGEGTANLVNMALEAGVRRLVYVSSVAALNREQKPGHLITLKDRWPEKRPPTSYAESKFAAEREVWRGQAEGLSVAVLYPSVMLGAGDWSGHNTPALWRMAASGRRVYPEGTNGFVDVRDVADAVLEVVHRDRNGDRFLLNAENLSWGEVQGLIARSIDQAPPSIKLRPWQSALLWPLEQVRAGLRNERPLITREVHRNVQAKYQYDGSDYPRETGKGYRDVRQTIQEIGEAFLRER